MRYYNTIYIYTKCEMRLVSVLFCLIVLGASSNLRRQMESMVRAVGIQRKEDNFLSVDDDFGFKLSPKKGATAPCKWKGVTCETVKNIGVVTSIKWNSNRKEKNYVELQWMYLGWLPATIRHIEIRNQNLRDDASWFDSRMLPRESINVIIDHCRMKGKIDMQALPIGIQRLDLPQNRFDGTIFFGNLTPSLKFADFQGNRFRLLLVDNTSLTSNFKRGIFDRRKSLRKEEIYGENIDSRICFE